MTNTLRTQENNVNLECNDSSAEKMPPFLCQLELPTVSKFCLYKELVFRVKSVLYSTRKADPLCLVVISLGYFEGLIGGAPEGMGYVVTGKSRKSGNVRV